jgi:hypothetical protein
MRTLLAATVALVAMTMTAAPSSAARQQPVRSGTILGWGATWPAMFNGDAKDCQWSDWDAGGNPECLVWLKSGCNPALAGRQPAVTASIVEVADLADGTRLRAFRWRATSHPGWGTGGGVVVQLWRNDCTEIRRSKWHSMDRTDWPQLNNRRNTSFRIPRAAKWMTVTTNDTALLEWTLR